MLYTALHRELGEDPGPITSEMLDAAIAKGLKEQHDLEWKRSLPTSAKDEWLRTVVGDVAAFANAQGGLIVYGVGEKGGAASARHSAELTDALSTAISQACAAMASPPILHVRHIPIGGDHPALALLVDASETAPHLIYDSHRKAFWAPIRSVTSTAFMTEADIERAYRRRHTIARDREEDLARKVESALERGHSHAVVVAAQLMGPARVFNPSDLARRSRQKLDEVSSHMPSLRTLILRWEYDQLSYRAAEAALDRDAMLTMHEDGTVVLTSPLAPVTSIVTASANHPRRFEEAILSALTCLLAAAEVAGSPLEYQVQVSFAPEARYFLFDRPGSEAVHVKGYRPVQRVVRLGLDRTLVAPAAFKLAEDVAMQIGVPPNHLDLAAYAGQDAAAVS